MRRCPDLRNKVCPGARMLLYRLSRRGVVPPDSLPATSRASVGRKWSTPDCANTCASAPSRNSRATARAWSASPSARRKKEGWIDAKSRISLIGDHPNDINAAKANRVRSIAVATGLVGAAELAGHSPDVLVPDLRSLSMEELFG